MQATMTAASPKKNSKIALIVFAAIFVLLYLLRDIGGINSPDIVFSGYCAIVFFVLDYGQSLAFFGLTLPLVLPDSEIALVYIVIVVAKMVLSNSIKLEFSAPQVIIVASMITIELFNVFSYTQGSMFEAIYNVAIMVFVLIIPVIWLENRDKISSDEFASAARMFILGAVLCGAVLIYMTVETDGWDVLLGTGNRLGQMLDYDSGTDMVTKMNTNRAAGSALCGIILDFLLIGSKKANNFLSIIILAFLVFVILLTKSRGSELSLVLVILIFVFANIKNGNAKTGILMLIASIVIFAITLIFFPDVWEGVIDRFFESDDLFNGRGYANRIFLDAWEKDVRSILIGYGSATLNVGTGLLGSPHNMIVDILSCWGAIGLILVIAWFVSIFKPLATMIPKNQRLLAFGLVICDVIEKMGGQYLIVRVNHLVLCYLFMAVLMYKSDKEKPEITNEKTV